MNYWLVLLGIAVTAMVIGPVMMLQPTSTQQAQEVLRRRAIELGLRISIVSIPKQAADADTPDAIPMYCLPWLRRNTTVQEWLLLRTSFSHGGHFLGTWQWHQRRQASTAEQAWLCDLLPKLPDSVRAVGVNSGGCCFYWNERGGIARLEQLVPLLEALRDHYPG